MTHLKFWGYSHIFETAEAKVVKFCLGYQVLASRWQTTDH